MSANLPGYLVVGNDWSAPVPQAKAEASFDAINGMTITVYYRDVWALWTYRLPVPNQPYALQPQTGFSKAVARQIEPGVLCEVEVTFQQVTGTGPIPATEVSQNGSTIKESITKHPKFNDGLNNWKNWWNPATAAFDPNYTAPGVTGPPSPMPSFLVGVTDYDVGSLTTTVTDYFDGDPGSIEDQVGQLSTPPDAGGGDNTYLCISGSKGKSGQWYTRSLVYQYAANGWPSEIYSS